jgi:hypothetical protein
MFVGYGFEKGKFCVAGSAKETIKNQFCWCDRVKISIHILYTPGMWVVILRAYKRGCRWEERFIGFYMWRGFFKSCQQVNFKVQTQQDGKGH